MNRARSPRATWIPAAVAAVGAAASLAGIAIDPGRLAFSYLAAYAAVLGIALGALALLMIAEVTGARWMTPLLPYARSLTGTLPLLALLFVPVALGMRLLYPWVPPLTDLAETLREHIQRKGVYLNVPFFLVRAAIYFLVWIGLAEWLGRASPRGRARASAVGLIAYGFTVSFAAIDWIMSLLPAWWSTIYGLYFWAGGFVAAIACVAVARHLIPPPQVKDPAQPSDRSNTLGKLLLTFLLFWIYIGFSQFLVIWIGDVPLEATWLAPRLAGSWAWFSLLLLIGQFALPFALLLPQASRRRPARLAGIAWVVLAFHYIDVYWLVLPARTPRGVSPSWLDLSTLMVVVGLTVTFAIWRAGAIAHAEEEEVALAAWW